MTWPLKISNCSFSNGEDYEDEQKNGEFGPFIIKAKIRMLTGVINVFTEEFSKKSVESREIYESSNKFNLIIIVLKFLIAEYYSIYCKFTGVIFFEMSQEYYEELKLSEYKSQSATENFIEDRRIIVIRDRRVYKRLDLFKVLMSVIYRIFKTLASLKDLDKFNMSCYDLDDLYS